MNDKTAIEIISQFESIIPKLADFIYNKLLTGAIEQWILNFIVSLPFLAGVSLGVWGLLNMINHKLAAFGVGIVIIIGGFIVI